MALSDIVCPPQSWKQFLVQDYSDSEWTREYIPNTNTKYTRGGHFAYDNQAPLGDDRLYAVGKGRIEHVDFGPYLGTRQFVLRFPDGSGFFYAHCSSRLSDGTPVDPGDYVGEMGASSTMDIGKHLHGEYLTTWNNWHSSKNHGTRFRLFKERKGMLSSEDFRKIRRIEKQQLGLFGARMSNYLIKQMADTSNTTADAILKQTADAFRLTGAEFAEEAEKL